jgi:hypothetical protein
MSSIVSYLKMNGKIFVIRITIFGIALFGSTNTRVLASNFTTKSCHLVLSELFIVPKGYHNETSTRLLLDFKNDPYFSIWLNKNWSELIVSEKYFAPSHLEEALTQYAKVVSSDEARSIRLSHQGQSVRLFGEEIKSRNNEFCEICEAYSPDHAPYYDYSRSEYAMRVLQLKSGDTVTFADGKSYKLGNFLGRGNSTHIFALADRPDQAIRIPYYSSEYGPGLEYENGVEQMKKLFELYPAIPPIAKKINLVYMAPDFSYSVVERVLDDHVNTENAWRNILHKLPRYESLPFQRIRDEIQDQDWKIFFDQIVALYKVHHPDDKTIPIFWIENLANQFLRESKSGLWRLVDWE